MMTTENSRADALTEAKLPDGSGFAIASMPLPKDHWLYADRTYSKPDQIEPDELPMPILTHRHRDAVVAAIRYAVRGATMCGKESDFDPDALVLNAAYALCGPHGQINEDAPAWERDIQKVIDSLDLEDWCGDESMISALERALAASPVEQPAAAPLENAELASMTRMFHAACHDLGLINEALGLDPDDGGAAPIIDAINELKVRAERPAPAPADERPAAAQIPYDGLTEEFTDEVARLANDAPGIREAVAGALESCKAIIAPQVDTAPAPVDERAAFVKELRARGVDVEPVDSVDPRLCIVGSCWLDDVLAAARAASANETGAEGAAPPFGVWFSARLDEGTLDVHDRKCAEFVYEKLITAHSPAMAAEAVASPAAGEVYQVKLPGDSESTWRDATESAYAVTTEAHRRIVYRAPPPAQADALEGLTDDQRSVIASLLESDVLSVDEDAVLREILAAHPGQPEPIAWESTTVAYTKYITDERYQKFSPEVRKWYKPYHCSSCKESRAEVTDEPSLTNPLTPYGMLCRALRIVTGTLLYDMAKHMRMSPASLSAMEFGCTPVTPEIVREVGTYFESLGVHNMRPALQFAIDAARAGDAS
ncbi:hypothetical protein OHZ10_29415 [Burkholderia arboris]|uniref:Uncharacterized protein n=1 Tax=Burkholderia arboris TaxID=488730 RepID=A0ABZ3DPG9_9BURK